MTREEILLQRWKETSVQERAEALWETLDDAITGLLSYDRKKDSSLPLGMIERMIDEDEVWVDDIVNYLSSKLRQELRET